MSGPQPGRQSSEPDGAGYQPEVHVLIVEHEAILREGARRVVEATAGMVVVDAAAEAEAGMKALRRLRPDIVLADARLPNGMGFFLARTAQREAPSVRVVLLSDKGGEALLQRAADAGVAAVVLENIVPEDLGAVLRVVAGGGVE